MPLNYSHFQGLPYSQKDLYVQKYGKFLAQRWHENYSIELYDLGSFYCERWLEQECRTQEQLRAFPTDACLDLYAPYLHQLHY